VAEIQTYNTIVLATLNEINLLLTNYVYTGYAVISNYIRVPLGIVASIYLVIFGYSIAMGWIKISMGNFVKTILKIAFIYMAVTEWALVSEYFVGFINHVIEDIGNILIAASPAMPGSDGLNGAMQVVLTQFSKLGNTLFKAGSITSMGAWIQAVLLWGFGYLIVGIGLFEIILAKVMLSVLFIFTPLIVILCFFKSFQGTFDRWLSAIIGFALLQLFVVAALSLGLSLAYWWLEAHRPEDILTMGNFSALPIIIIGIICIGLVLKAGQLAQNLGGMVSTSGASAMVGGVLGGFMGSYMSSVGAVRSIFTKNKNGTPASDHSALKSVHSDLRKGGTS